MHANAWHLLAIPDQLSTRPWFLSTHECHDVHAAIGFIGVLHMQMYAVIPLEQVVLWMNVAMLARSTAVQGVLRNTDEA